MKLLLLIWNWIRLHIFRQDVREWLIQGKRGEEVIELGSYTGTPEEATREAQSRWVNHLWKTNAFVNGNIVHGHYVIKEVGAAEAGVPGN